MKYGLLIIIGVTLLLFLAGCIDEKEKTELISLCNNKTNISYSDSPNCLTATKCHEKYNSIFSLSLNSSVLQPLETAKSNYQKSVVDSWVGISNLLNTTKELNSDCGDPASDKFVTNLEYLYSYTKISSRDLANLGYRQTILLGTIKTILEDNDINLLGDTQAYKIYVEITDNWNTVMNAFVLVNKEFNLQQTKYNYWATFNNSYLYAPGKVPSQSVDSYKNIIKYGLLQESFFGFLGDVIPENTLLSAFADAIYDNVIGNDSISYENLSAVFEQYFNLSDFIKEYSSLFGYKGTLINNLRYNISNLDTEMAALESVLNTRKQELEKSLNGVMTLNENSEVEAYLLSHFNIDSQKLNYSENIVDLKLQLQNLDKSLGKKYQTINKVEQEVKTIQEYQDKHQENSKLVSFLCGAELNSKITENNGNPTLKYYFDKFKTSKDIVDCYYFLKSEEEKDKQNCTTKIDTVIQELSLDYWYDKQFSCEAFDELESNILQYLDKSTFGDFRDNVFSVSEKINIIAYKSPMCVTQEGYDLIEFKKQIKTNTNITNSISEFGVLGLTNKINYWNTRGAEILKEYLPCHLLNKSRISGEGLIFDVGFNYSDSISVKLKTNYNLEGLSGKSLVSYSCNSTFCDLIFNSLSKTTVLAIKLKNYKQDKQEINYSDMLEISQKFCFENETRGPTFDEMYSADKIKVYSGGGKEIIFYFENKKINLWNINFNEGDCIFIKYYFYDAVKKNISLESAEKISDITTRYKYKLILENKIPVTQNNLAVTLDFYYDSSKSPSIFDSIGREYKITKTNNGFVFYADIGALSTETYSLVFYTNDERKKFISELTDTKTKILNLADSKSATIKNDAKKLLEKIKTLEKFEPRDNKSAFEELEKTKKEASDMMIKNHRALAFLEEKEIIIKRLKNQKTFLELLKGQDLLIKNEFVNTAALQNIVSDIQKIDSQVSSIESLSEGAEIPKIEDIKNKYTRGLESTINDYSKKYYELQTQANTLGVMFYENGGLFESAKEGLYYDDYNALFGIVSEISTVIKKNQEVINVKTSEMGDDILNKFTKINDIKQGVESVWERYNFLLGLFNSNSFDTAKKYEKIPVKLSDLKDNKSILDSASKEVVVLKSIEEKFKKDYADNKFDAINNFDSKKLDKAIFNYTLASNNISNIEKTLDNLATKNVELAEQDGGDKSLLYDAKTSLENKDYFNAIINAKRSLAGAGSTTSKTAIYGLSILIGGAIMFALYSLVFKKRKKKKITYYTVPK